ncbi:MAG: glycosyltransferase family 2 protein [Deltaproteobacteria bacterium]|nr:glycosyltransferase family 2 protein [Deltaproteobacteria bacterium]
MVARLRLLGRRILATGGAGQGQWLVDARAFVDGESDPEMRVDASNRIERVLIVLGAVAALVGLTAADLGPSKITMARELVGEDLWRWIGRPAIALAGLAMISLVWRIALWLRYKPAEALAAQDPRLPEITVVIPAYNEGETVYHTIRSLLASDYPAHKLSIYCVDDGSKDDTASWARSAAVLAPDRVHVIEKEQNAGKRHALYTGFQQVRTSLVVTVDSDTVLPKDALRALVTPMVLDEKVGAVAGRIDVLNRGRNLLTRMLAVRYRIGFDFSRAYQSELGSVFVTPGAFSCYRVSVVKPHWDAWRDVKFLGANCSNGDDHHMANRVLWAGYKTVYQSNAVARTTVPSTYKRLSLMYLRWARSNLRESTLYMGHLPDLLRSWRNVPAVIDAAFSYLQLPLRMYLLFAGWLLILMHPVLLLRSVAFALTFALLHMVFFLRSERSLDAVYTLAYSVFALLTLQWIYPMALITVRQSRWLTR